MKQEERNKLSTDKIITAATKEFAQNGAKVLSLNTLCKNNNISKGKFYHYFNSKDELYIACVNHVYGEASKSVADFKTDSNITLADNLNRYYESRIDYWSAHTEDFILFKSSMNLYDYDLIEKARPIQEIYRKTANDKMLEMIHSSEYSNIISDKELCEILENIYNTIFIRDIDKIIQALMNGDAEKADVIKKSVIDLYKRLNRVLMYGIIPK